MRELMSRGSAAAARTKHSCASAVRRSASYWWPIMPINSAFRGSSSMAFRQARSAVSIWRILKAAFPYSYHIVALLDCLVSFSYNDSDRRYSPDSNALRASCSMVWKSGGIATNGVANHAPPEGPSQDQMIPSSVEFQAKEVEGVLLQCAAK